MKTVLLQGKEKWRDRGLTVLFVIGLWMLLAVFFDFYYDLNDDTAMKDILSGTYTGTPDGHCIQMLYPLGWCISLFYRLMPAVPWYGIFLCGCQFGALWIGLYSILSGMHEIKRKKTWLLLLTLAAGVLFLYEFVFIQYTVTVGLLMTAALVRLSVGPEVQEKGFWQYHILTILSVVLAFYLRTEMMLLMCPFLGLVAVWKLLSERKESENAKQKQSVLIRYSGAVLILAVLMGVGIATDAAAYGSSEWKQFRQFFDARTEVYDFYGIPDYDMHEAFYNEIGLTEAQYTLLENYNFDLDDEIDADLMEKIRIYAAEHQELSIGRRLYLSVYTYVYRFLHGQELIFDLLLVVSYFFLTKAAWKGRNYGLLGKLMLLFGVRTVIWLFLLYRGRTPERIIHPLYLAELVILALLFLQNTKALQWKKYEKSAILSLYVILFGCTALYHVQNASTEYKNREEINEQWQDWKTYCRKKQEQFFYVDVYSSVAYSEKLFSDTASDYRNFDLPGGWCVKSPIAAEKRAVAGFSNAKEGLLTDSIFFVADSTKPERIPEFLISWYQEKGNEVSLNEIDKCGKFSIYRIIETENR